MRANILADLLARALGLVRIFLTPFILLPAEYGQLGLASAMLLYVSFADLGLLRQFEISSSMRPETLRAELRTLFRKLFPRLALSAVVLGAVLGLEFSSWTMAGIAVLTVFSFNLDALAQMILRHQNKQYRLAFIVFFQAMVTTALLAPIAFQWRAPGLLLLQGAAPLLSFALARMGWRSTKTTHEPAPWAEAWGSSMALWLLLGQVLMMIWITLDRLLLSRTLSADELGFWNLGSMMTGVLLGISNTWGTLRMRLWKNHPEGLFTPMFWGLLFLLWIGGVASLFGFTQWFAPKYQEGRLWNLAWFSVNVGMGLVFVFDAFVRARLRQQNDARQWFLIKGIAILCGMIAAGLCFVFGLDPRASAILGISASVLLLLIISQQFHHKLVQASEPQQQSPSKTRSPS